MEWKLTSESLSSLATDAIIVFHGKNKESTEGITRMIDKSLDYRISSLITEGEIVGTLGEVTVLHNWGKIPSTRVFVVGIGEEKETDLVCLKDAVANAARKARRMGIKSLGISCPSFSTQRYNTVDCIQSLVEGVELGAYKHQSYQSKESKGNQLKTVLLSQEGVSLSALETGIERGQVFATSTNLARYLVHEPPNRLIPKKMVSYAEEIASKRSMDLEVLDEDQMEKLGMHALLSVAKGSRQSPYMIVLSYKGAPESSEVLGLVGKGITFDSGGLQIKPGSKMVDMKGDMGGAAVVLGAMDAIGALKPHSNVIGVIGTCENMCDGNAYRPGDVLNTYNGKTIEVAHTDAEGRVVLADALHHATSFKPDLMLDMATLTGAVIVALGDVAAGVMGNDQGVIDAIVRAADRSGEKVWQLPLWDTYRRDIDSSIADVKNTGLPRMAGTITAGKFLEEFVSDVPWAHLDIAGVAWADARDNYFTKKGQGGTAFGVRLVTEFLRTQ